MIIRKNLILGSALIAVISISINLSVNAGPTKEDHGTPAKLPLPSSLPLVEYELILYPWINKRKYTQLGWSVDKDVRDTGPFLNGVYYGTHPAVRIYYSPGVMKWLLAGRPEGMNIPDGAIIVKEMFTPPAAIYQEMAQNPRYKNPQEYEKFIRSMVNSWTVIIKDSKGSSDGWFWASVSPEGIVPISKQLDTLENRGDESLRWSGFGMPCLRCHSSAKAELTFSDLVNIKNQPGDPLIFKVDDSWRTPDYIANNYPVCKIKDDPFVVSHFYFPVKDKDGDVRQPSPSTKKCEPYSSSGSTDPVIFNDHYFYDNAAFTIPQKPLAKVNKTFIDMFNQFPIMKRAKVTSFPAAWQDHVVMPANHPTKYISSDNCLGCHGGLGGSPNRDVMFIPNQNGKTADGFNVSEYGEWRWSPMGVAGRDPIFHAQLESEMAYLIRDSKLKPSPLKAPLKTSQNATTNLCLSCHGAMGQRQLAADAKTHKKLDGNFNVDYFYLVDPVTKALTQKQKKEGVLEYSHYGALAREGISCMVCHHITASEASKVKNWRPKNPKWLGKGITASERELAYTLFHHSTGTYQAGPANEVFGPFDVSETPMHNALNVKPLQNPFTSNSQMCGNCHTINLPNIGAKSDEFPVLKAASATSDSTKPFDDYPHTIEQATFLEWQNSAFAEVDANGKKGASFQSCQDCHMPGGFKNQTAKIDIDQIVTQIASIQDSTYPDAGHLLPVEDIDIPVRDNYKRHTHVGLNVFLLSMMDQYSDILGLNKSDYMTTSKTGVDLAIESMIQQAQDTTVDISISNTRLVKSTEVTSNNNCTDKTGERVLLAQVNVNNKTGHRLPSGVAFRRVFLEFTVFDGNKPIWSSGRTNAAGVILGADGKPLATEFLGNDKMYQRHHEVIDCQNQVQIYEELTTNSQNEFTTSFIHRVNSVKDNRLLPDGWRHSSFFADQGEVIQQFMAATNPHGRADNDPDYQNPDNSIKFQGKDTIKYQVALPKGTNTANLHVKATLYSQAIPPYWLKQRFDAVKDSKDPKASRATRRLYYMASHLDLADTPMENWKLLLVSDSVKVK